MTRPLGCARMMSLVLTRPPQGVCPPLVGGTHLLLSNPWSLLADKPSWPADWRELALRPDPSVKVHVPQGHRKGGG